MMEAVRTSEMSVNNHFTRQYIPEDNSEHQHHGLFQPMLSLHLSWETGEKCKKPKSKYLVVRLEFEGIT
jgi:hypothetical protein